jgi:hypothetical protein
LLKNEKYENACSVKFYSKAQGLSFARPIAKKHAVQRWGPAPDDGPWTVGSTKRQIGVNN